MWGRGVVGTRLPPPGLWHTCYSVLECVSNSTGTLESMVVYYLQPILLLLSVCLVCVQEPPTEGEAPATEQAAS